MKLLDGRALLESEKQRLREKCQSLTAQLGRAPSLRVIIVGDDPASKIYVGMKEKLSAEIGIDGRVVRLPKTSTPAEVKKIVVDLNSDPSVDGILIQRPLPSNFRDEEVLFWVSPEKDVDALHPETSGKMWQSFRGFESCTPKGIMKLLEANGFSVDGKRCCIIGRSPIVGKPLAALLLSKNATVTLTHSKTKNLSEETKRADFLFVAAGKPHLIDASYVSAGSIVIDVGIHRDAGGKILGDVKFDEVSKIVKAITPVPGGVGPMTLWGLMDNVLISAENRTKIKK